MMQFTLRFFTAIKKVDDNLQITHPEVIPLIYFHEYYRCQSVFYVSEGVSI